MSGGFVFRKFLLEWGPLPLLVGLGFLVVYPPGRPDPIPNENAFGCYTAARAPPLRFDSDGMTVVQAEPFSIDYEIKRTKKDLALRADFAVGARHEGDAYVYSVREPQSMFIGEFKTLVDGKLYRITNEAYLPVLLLHPMKSGGFFEFERIVYSRASPEACDAGV